MSRFLKRELLHNATLGPAYDRLRRRKKNHSIPPTITRAATRPAMASALLPVELPEVVALFGEEVPDELDVEFTVVAGSRIQLVDIANQAQ